FNQCYSGAPVSAPARSVLMTGLHTGHTPVRANDEAGDRGDVWSHEAMLADSTLEGQGPMPADTKTLGSMMQKAGYKTGVVGKWGLGYPGSVSTPNKMGFDFFYGYNCQRQSHTYYPMFLYRNENREYLDNAPLLTPNQKLDSLADKYDAKSYEKFTRKQYSGDLMFDELVGFVEANKKEPFFLMWTTPIPHVSLQAPQRWIDHYQKKFNETEPYLSKNGYLPARYPHATYAAMVSYFDEQIGLLVEKLKADGLYDNTIIIFSSDNGATFNGGTDSPWFNSGGIFRSDRGYGKGSLREGGIRVPLIFTWPNQIKEPRESNHICAFWDVMPTLGEITDIETPKTDGISFLPEVMGKTQAQHEALYWEYPEGTGSRAVRMGKWKGIIFDIKKGNNTMELYNLENDILEEKNVAAENPEIVEQIRTIMKREHVTPVNPKFIFFEE
ncbi:MAG: sulfatase-like hydrolase/transferase, partial [Rikenellaceae bacterium]